ncbi:MAG: hypothetical protein Q9224_006440 [Gallowayella concinna]
MSATRGKKDEAQQRTVALQRQLAQREADLAAVRGAGTGQLNVSHLPYLVTASSAAPYGLSSLPCLEIQFDQRLEGMQELFPKVDKKYFIAILRGNLNASDIHRFDDDYTGPAGEHTSIIPMMHCFEVFCQIVIALAPPQTHVELQLAMSLYRSRLYSFTEYKTFASIQLYHDEFVAYALDRGKDRPDLWRSEPSYIVNKLVDRQEGYSARRRHSLSAERGYDLYEDDEHSV